MIFGEITYARYYDDDHNIKYLGNFRCHLQWQEVPNFNMSLFLIINLQTFLIKNSSSQIVK